MISNRCPTQRPHNKHLHTALCDLISLSYAGFNPIFPAQKKYMLALAALFQQIALRRTHFNLAIIEAGRREQRRGHSAS